MSADGAEKEVVGREAVISALVGHLVGDYLLQNDWMALNKKQSTLHCAVHCAIWTWFVILFACEPTESFWSFGSDAMVNPGWFSWRVAAVLFVTHFIQDRTNIIRWWMSLIGQEKFATGPCAPWSIIVVDNVWHIVTIWAVWRCLI